MSEYSNSRPVRSFPIVAKLCRERIERSEKWWTAIQVFQDELQAGWNTHAELFPQFQTATVFAIQESYRDVVLKSYDPESGLISQSAVYRTEDLPIEKLGEALTTGRLVTTDKQTGKLFYLSRSDYYEAVFTKRIAIEALDDLVNSFESYYDESSNKICTGSTNVEAAREEPTFTAIEIIKEYRELGAQGIPASERQEMLKDKWLPHNKTFSAFVACNKQYSFDYKKPLRKNSAK